MKNSQPTIRLCLSIFFVFGMFQTAQSQTIDDKSKVILDKVETHYSSFETMRYKLIFIFNPDTEDEEQVHMEISTDNKYLKATSDYSTMITDGKTIKNYIYMM